MIAADLDGIDAKEAVKNLLSKGLVCLTAKDSLRFLPPLVITRDDLAHALKIIEETLSDMKG